MAQAPFIPVQENGHPNYVHSESIYSEFNRPLTSFDGDEDSSRSPAADRRTPARRRLGVGRMLRRRERRVRITEPGVDAGDMERVSAAGQHAHRVAVRHGAQAHRALYGLAYSWLPQCTPLDLLLCAQLASLLCSNVSW